jgi:hypothetical protein
MDTQLQPGQQVIVNAYGGKRTSVIVIEDRGDVVLVCGMREFELSKAQNRDPVTIGLHREDVSELVAPARNGIVPEGQREFRGSKAGD